MTLSTHDDSTDNGYDGRPESPGPGAESGPDAQREAPAAQPQQSPDDSRGAQAQESSYGVSQGSHSGYTPPSIPPPGRPAPPSPTPGGHSPTGSPYTGVPATPAGYDFSRASSRPQGLSAATSPYASATSGPYGAGAAGAPGTAGPAYPGASPSPTAQPQQAHEQAHQQAYAPAGAGYQAHQERRGPGWGALVGATVVAALLGSAGAVAVVKATDSGQDSAAVASSAPTAIATGDTTQTVTSQGQTPDWEGVTAAVSNAVVAIAIEKDGQRGEGSGFIYDKAGHILTNDHVVGGASRVAVTLADGRIYDAEITGTDPATDLAVIELVGAPKDLTVVQLGDSDEMVTGQDVMAIGNPLGLSSTATTGIVSALNRPVVTGKGQSTGGDGTVYTNAIQIDAAVNPGNSGGPLFDERGHVVGVTSSIITASEDNPGSIGIGFAIPVNLADKVAKQLIESGSATHAYLGVGLDNGVGEVGDEVRSGAKITKVESGAPADKAGLKENDVIVAIDGKPTAQADALTGFVRQYSAGETVKLSVIRDKEKLDVEATLVERPDS
ncbi:PDZ domain-containing protein [Actinomyces bowdenii]|uniref:PDZ domain-containing protein n=1 Tax=Actinomyces bowdenii TaxID=131109 RepID=A0A3P1V779_9ACTO|nr:PDZ domain-containing protein [Actinomyces bowdenii]